MDILSCVFALREKSLQSGGFGLYRKYLVRRIVSLRKHLAISTSPSKRQNVHKVVTAQDIEKNHKFIDLLIFTSEMAWAQGMQMKSARQDASATPKSASNRRHVLSKFNKAAKNATHLLHLQKETSTDPGHPAMLHAQAYQLFFLGGLAFEKRQWTESLRIHSELHVIHTRLSISRVPFADTSSWALANSWIDANLRYSAYQVGIPRSTSLDKIIGEHIAHSTEATQGGSSNSQAEVLSPEAESLSEDDALSVPETIQWRSRSVKVEDAATAQALLQAQRAENRLRSFFLKASLLHPSEVATAYDGILGANQDAVDSVKIAIDELASEGVAQGDRRMQSLQITRTAVHYALISWRIGRNRVLCGQDDGLATLLPHHPLLKSPHRGPPRTTGKSRVLKRISEHMVLHDSILQSLESIESLPGVASDATFLGEIRQKRAYFNALRIVAVAQSHYTVEKFSNSLALLVKAREILNSVGDKRLTPRVNSANEPPQSHVSLDQFEYLHNLTDSLIQERRGIVEVATSVNASERRMVAPRGSLILDLQSYCQHPSSTPNIISWPPELQPIPVKPIFLDVAYNYIKYPEKGSAREGRVEGATVPEKGAPKKGWFGFGR